jgi:hypothetical protein
MLRFSFDGDCKFFSSHLLKVFEHLKVMIATMLLVLLDQNVRFHVVNPFLSHDVLLLNLFHNVWLGSFVAEIGYAFNFFKQLSVHFVLCQI